MPASKLIGRGDRDYLAKIHTCLNDGISSETTKSNSIPKKGDIEVTAYQFMNTTVKYEIKYLSEYSGQITLEVLANDRSDIDKVAKLLKGNISPLCRVKNY